VALIEESLGFLEQELADAGLRIDVEIDEPLPAIQGDRDQIKQVFFNILKNAREATGSGGGIRIRTRSDDEFVYVQVGDTGQGIDEHDLAKIFQPYFTTKPTGHGLGMMVVQRIMRDHGGQIGIDSHKGQGTVVTLQFPQKHRRVRMLGAGEG
jgi:signal transduction histidine kinase